jgi:hypothetical protein
MESVFNVDDLVTDRLEKAGSHIVSMESKTVCDMRWEDWQVLDWPQIRDVAKNRITRLLKENNFKGFDRVVYDKMPEGKPAYYYPRSGSFRKAVSDSVAQIREWENEPEEESSEDTDRINTYIDELQLVYLYEKIAILRLLTALKNAASSGCSMLGIIENGIDDRGPVWAHVLVTALILYFGFEQAFEMIEEQING